MEHAQSVMLELAGPMTVPRQIPAEPPKKCVIPSAASFARCCYSPCGIVARLHASWLLGNSLATVVAPPSAPWYNTKENHSNSAAAQENKTARNSQFRLQEDPEMILKCALLLIITLLPSQIIETPRDPATIELDFIKAEVLRTAHLFQCLWPKQPIKRDYMI